jgi:type IV secretion system protein VirD4
MLLDDLPRGAGGTDPRTWQPPCETFPPPDAIAATPRLAYDPAGGFVLGRANGQLIGLPPDEDRHIVLVANNRAGKGESIIIPNMLEYKGSILAPDPKGELASITSRRRAQDLKQKLCILDPFGITREWCEPWRKQFNPLALLRPDNPYIIEDAGMIASSLVISEGGGNEIHWSESARILLTACLLFVATAPEYTGKRDLISLYYTVGGRPPGYDELDEEQRELPRMERLKRRMFNHAADLGRQSRLAHIGEAIDMGACDFFERDERERLGVLSTARRHVAFLGFPSLATVLRGHDFDLSELKTSENGMTVFMCLPSIRMSTCARWFRLMVDLGLAAMERTRQKPQIPVLFALEEFAVMRRMESIETAVGLLATYGVRLLIVLQDLPQIKDLYEGRHESILGSAGCTICFGNNDPMTLEYISRRLGKTSVPVNRASPLTWGAEVAGASGDQWVNEIHDLMTTSEAAMYFGRDDPKRRCLVMRPSFPPLILERLRYWTDDEYRGKFDTWQN